MGAIFARSGWRVRIKRSAQNRGSVPPQSWLVYGLAGDDENAASIARGVLNEAAVRDNLAYCTLLRSMQHSATSSVS